MVPPLGRPLYLGGMATRPLHVIATSCAGTLTALETARHIAVERRTPVVLLVPRVVSFTRSLDQPDEDPVAIAESYRTIVDQSGIAANVRVCFCREPHDVFGRLLIDDADVVVGGPRGRWWPSPEERLARRLTAEGHHVTFADVEAAPRADLSRCEPASV